MKSFYPWAMLPLVTLALIGCGRSLPPAKSHSELSTDLKSPDKAVKLAAAVEVKKLGPGAASMTEDLLAALKDNDPEVRQAAAEALGHIGPEADSKTIEQVQSLAAAEKNSVVQTALAEAVKAMKPDPVRPAPK